MTKSIKKSTSHVQNPVEKIQANPVEKSISSKKKYEAIMFGVIMIGLLSTYAIIKSKPKRE